MRNIKLIWDFKGQDAQKTAEHHAIHLEEFFYNNTFENLGIGTEQSVGNHFITYVGVHESIMIELRDLLKPNRAQLWPEL